MSLYDEVEHSWQQEMARRKSNTPGPAAPGPTSPKSPQDLDHGSRGEPYSPDLNKSPAFSLKRLSEAQRDQNEQMDNPWAELTPSRSKPLPPILQAGATDYRHTRRRSQELPESLKAGNSKQETPRSSFESVRSKDSWEYDDEQDQEDTLLTSTGAKAKTPAVLQTTDQSEANGAPLTSPPEQAAIRRKPLPMSPIIPSIEAPTAEPCSEFASNNPWRRPSTNVVALLTESQQPNNEIDAGVKSSKGEEKAIETPIQMSASIGVEDRPLEEFSSYYQPSQPDLGLQSRAQETNDQSTIPSHPSAPPPPPPAHPLSPPPPPPAAPSPHESFTEQLPLIPVTPNSRADPSNWQPEVRDPLPQHTVPSAPQTVPQAVVKNNLVSPGGQETGIVGIDATTSEFPDFSTYETRAQEPDLSTYQSQAQEPDLGTYQSQAQEPDLSTEQAQAQEPDLLGEEEPGPPLPERRYESPPTKPPRPILVTSTISEQQLAKLREQRQETYQIKHFNWFDHKINQLRQSSMLTQNKNGPCPLLALVNAMILSEKDDMHSALGSALATREQVSLGLLIESLMDELITNTRGSTIELPDVDDLNGFLLRLHTGMNANPRLAVSRDQAPNLMDAENFAPSISHDRKPGTFEETPDMKLYGAFSIPLVHGWLPPRTDPAKAAFTRSAQTYEDAQTIQFGEEELEDKLSRSGLNPEEQRLYEDIMAVKQFLSSYPTQLTTYGLSVITESLFPGGFAIMFRNDHFSTIYKHPDSGQLFTLITDAGYQDKDEVIWESLNDITGKNSEFFSGDFRPVGNVESSNAPAAPSQPQVRSRLQPQSQSHQPSHSSNFVVPGTESHARGSANRHPPPGSPLDPTSPQEQTDADFAMALQLQEEEDARANNNSNSNNANSRRSGLPQTQIQTPRSSTPTTLGQGIPIRLRNPVEREGARPTIPPRAARSVAVNRPPAEDGEAPPPSYDEASKGAPYIPPIGHPSHPTYAPSASPQISSQMASGQMSLPPHMAQSHSQSHQPPRPSYGQAAGQVQAYSQSHAGPSRPPGQPHRRRMSAFEENARGLRPVTSNQSERAAGQYVGGGAGYPLMRRGTSDMLSSRGGTPIESWAGSGKGKNKRGGGDGDGEDRDCVVM